MENIVDRKDFYLHDRPDLFEQTKKRLEEIAELGLREVGTAEFGINDVMSGLYIETLWNSSDDLWNSYITWVKEIKAKHL